MLKIPSRYSHFAFGVIQAGITCSIAAAIASIQFISKGFFFQHWLKSWGISWLTMLPIVMLSAHFIRRMVDKMIASS
nr:DUF2798 domain-containing protein [Cupriavidus sp. YR651]